MLPQDAPHLDEYLDMHRLGWPPAPVQPAALQHLRVRLLQQVDTEHGMGATHLSELLRLYRWVGAYTSDGNPLIGMEDSTPAQPKKVPSDSAMDHEYTVNNEKALCNNPGPEGFFRLVLGGSPTATYQLNSPRQDSVILKTLLFGKENV